MAGANHDDIVGFCELRQTSNFPTSAAGAADVLYSSGKSRASTNLRGSDLAKDRSKIHHGGTEGTEKTWFGQSVFIRGLTSVLQVHGSVRAVFGAASEKVVHLPRNLRDGDDGDHHQRELKAAVQPLDGSLEFRVGCVAHDQQIESVDEDVQHHEVHGAEQEAKRHPTLLPARPQENDGVSNNVSQHEHHEQRVQGLEHRAEVHECDTGPENQELVLQTDQPPDAEDRPQEKAGGGFGCRVLPLSLGEFGQGAWVPLRKEIESRLEEFHQREYDGDPGKGGNRAEGVLAQDSECGPEAAPGGRDDNRGN